MSSLSLHGRSSDLQGVVANTLNLYPNGAACRVFMFTLVGFIDLLGRIAPITGKEEKKNKKQCSDRTGDDKKNWPHIRVLFECCDCCVNDVSHTRNRENREPALSASQSYWNEDLRRGVNGEGQSPTS